MKSKRNLTHKKLLENQCQSCQEYNKYLFNQWETLVCFLYIWIHWSYHTILDKKGYIFQKLALEILNGFVRKILTNSYKEKIIQL